MSRTVLRSRLLLLLLLVLNFAWMYCAGSQSTFYVRFRDTIEHSYLALIATWVVFGLVRSYQLSLAPKLARNAEVNLARLVGLLELTGLAGALAGANWGFGAGHAYFYLYPRHDLGQAWVTANGVGFFLLASAVIPAILFGTARTTGAEISDGTPGLFFLHRDHVSNRNAITYLLASVSLWAVVLAGYWYAAPGRRDWHLLSESVYLPSRFAPFECGLLAGVAVTLIQFHWHRALGFVSWAFLLLIVALLGLALTPSAEWPLLVLGLAGVGHAPLIAGLLAALPARQRFGTLFFLHAAIPVAAYAIVGAGQIVIIREDGNFWTLAILAAFALLATVGFTWALFRPFIELINEVVFRLAWMPKAYGPGKFTMPTRGPALIVSNHTAMFDPVWVTGVVPMPVRAMMLADYLDIPFLKWLCGTVYKAIRVPSDKFRRTAPEVDEAVAALKQGDCVLICPEGWLRRHEEQPIRRFAQGVVRILEQVPDTPVIACWIEDGWGSWLSWKNGPPGKNKKMDIFKRLRLGVAAPELVPPEILKDDKVARRYLMEKVLHARTFLGLPAYPMPVHGTVGEKDEKEGNGQ